MCSCVLACVCVLLLSAHLTAPPGLCFMPPGVLVEPVRCDMSEGAGGVEVWSVVWRVKWGEASLPGSHVVSTDLTRCELEVRHMRVSLERGICE